MPSRNAFLSVFTGAGGLDLGLTAAGFDARLCLEIDEHAVATLRQQKNPWPVARKGNVLSRRPHDIIREAGIRRGELTLLAGGPPCQPFSKARYWAGDAPRLSDPRADTVAAFLDLAERALPEIVLIENVRGVSFTGKSEALELILRRFHDINRRERTVYQPCVVAINAAEYGVPQLRERVFIIAHRDGGMFTLPPPTHGPNGRSRFVNAWDAIGDLDDTPHTDDLQLRGKYADLLASIPEGRNYLWHTDRGGGESLFGWRTRFWSFLLKLAKALPSWTVAASPGPATGPFHWRNRLLSTRELARLQTFPDHYHFSGPRREVVRQIGNAVPPALSEFIGIELRRQLLHATDLPRRRRYLQRQRDDCPAPEPPRDVPAQFHASRGRHPDHPGTGKGPSPQRSVPVRQ